MPTAFRSGPYRLFFYSADRMEPRHIHVERGIAVAKFWLDPVRLATNRGFAPPELAQVERSVHDNAAQLLKAWNDFFAH
jgi:Domain of unknown function (DUF4160)